jgi:hypothetical protein
VSLVSFVSYDADLVNRAETIQGTHARRTVEPWQLLAWWPLVTATVLRQRRTHNALGSMRGSDAVATQYSGKDQHEIRRHVALAWR